MVPILLASKESEMSLSWSHGILLTDVLGWFFIGCAADNETLVVTNSRALA
jgi:hypothetical protein